MSLDKTRLRAAPTQHGQCWLFDHGCELCYPNGDMPTEVTLAVKCHERRAKLAPQSMLLPGTLIIRATNQVGGIYKSVGHGYCRQYLIGAVGISEETTRVSGCVAVRNLPLCGMRTDCTRAIRLVRPVHLVPTALRELVSDLST